MAIKVVLPSALQPWTAGSGTVMVEERCATVRDVLTALGTRWPGIRDRILTEQGEVRPHVNLFLGEENIRYLGGLEAAVKADETMVVVPSVSGG